MRTDRNNYWSNILGQSAMTKMILKESRISSTKFTWRTMTCLQKTIESNGCSETIPRRTIGWMAKIGHGSKTDSLYNSPVYCVPKKVGNGLKIVQNFRELNQKSYMDKYTTNNIHECIGDICKLESTIFTAIDLTSGFWKMSLHKDSVPKTAFAIPRLGQFEWLTSPIRLIGCSATFQRFMDKLIENLKNVIAYINSRTHEEHLVTLDTARLTENKMKINLAKCYFRNRMSLTWDSDLHLMA